MSDNGKPDLPKREHISPDAERTETKRISVNASERPNPRFEAAQRRTQRRLEASARAKSPSDATDHAGTSTETSTAASTGTNGHAATKVSPSSGFSFSMTNAPAGAHIDAPDHAPDTDDTLGLDELTEMGGGFASHAADDDEPEISLDD